jgi:hypothetical protein
MDRTSWFSTALGNNDVTRATVDVAANLKKISEFAESVRKSTSGFSRPQDMLHACTWWGVVTQSLKDFTGLNRAVPAVKAVDGWVNKCKGSARSFGLFVIPAQTPPPGGRVR